MFDFGNIVQTGIIDSGVTQWNQYSFLRVIRLTSVNSNHLADYLFRCVPFFFFCRCCFRLNCAATHVIFCNFSHFIAVVLFAALYINVIRIHLSFFASNFLDPNTTKRTERIRRRRKRRKKNAFAFHLNFKTKKDIYRGLYFPYVISCFLKWKSLWKGKPSVTHYGYKNMFLRFLTNRAYFD